MRFASRSRTVQVLELTWVSGSVLALGLVLAWDLVLDRQSELASATEKESMKQLARM